MGDEEVLQEGFDQSDYRRLPEAHLRQRRGDLPLYMRVATVQGAQPEAAGPEPRGIEGRLLSLCTLAVRRAPGNDPGDALHAQPRRQARPSQRKPRLL